MDSVLRKKNSEKKEKFHEGSWVGFEPTTSCSLVVSTFFMNERRDFVWRVAALNLHSGKLSREQASDPFNLIGSDALEFPIFFMDR